MDQLKPINVAGQAGGDGFLLENPGLLLVCFKEGKHAQDHCASEEEYHQPNGHEGVFDQLAQSRCVHAMHERLTFDVLGSPCFNADIPG
ncbi:MAG TPA: hypothetical protein VFY35_11660 [Burkholderiaceae bacterium]|nr:hypothetical protein [Burkholderiaceae bacterium]